ncbi:MAG: hypothetical protein GXZ07_06740 [Firmicutes bacterium]|jgi:hypothetical protein|nr:hypothetical protein [Bacillota bacterium]
MNLLMYGLEFSVLGFAVVLVALFALALILLLFNKMFTGSESTPKQGKGGQDIKGAQLKNQPVQAKETLTPAVPLQGEKPEIVAAAMGALLYALEGGRGRRFAVTKVTGAAMPSSWGQVGRSRLLQLRQDFVLSKRGKIR